MSAIGLHANQFADKTAIKRQTYQIIVQVPIGKEKVTLPFQENITN